ncbi:MAG: AbrB/MazE/SpoVT family DNA-binding domain-containing protein [Candidatus Brockarchaeota archaeon]|nr:AbrB/MazE/SpoVT family DNA-binding domain-containing protein [Candidatus Brockarchaeota archaeon]
MPKIIRETLGIQPGDEIIMWVREKELLMKPELDRRSLSKSSFPRGERS